MTAFVPSVMGAATTRNPYRFSKGDFPMPVDPSFSAQNRAATNRIRALAARLTDEELRHPVGEHWTVAIALAHLAFWDRRVLSAVAQAETSGKLSIPEIDLVVNDLSLPLWAAIPPREAARLAIETAEALDHRFETLPPDVLEAVERHNKRWLVRALHRNEHLDEVEAALRE
jgi:hypothetical protein